MTDFFSVDDFVHKIVDFCFQSGHNLFKKWGYDDYRKAAEAASRFLST